MPWSSLLISNFSVSLWKRKEGLKGDLGLINQFLLLHPSPIYSKGFGGRDLCPALETSLQHQAEAQEVRNAHNDQGYLPAHSSALNHFL